jgi:hypothetical protein
MKSSQRRIGALLSPQGVYYVEYRRSARGLEILHHAGESALLPRPVDAGRMVLSHLQSQPGENEFTVNAVLRGFGSVYHIMKVPRAPIEVLTPIARRELNRLYPELEDPTVQIVPGMQFEEAGNVQQEILIAAAPTTAVNGILNGLVAENVAITNLTVLSRAAQRVYDEIDGSRQTTALVLFLPGAPFIGFFEAGLLRQASEPLVQGGLTAFEHLQTVLEQLTRGDLYMRQHYDATIERVLISAGPDEQEIVLEALRKELSAEIHPFASDVGAPEALVALGAVLDAERPPSLSLLPPDPARAKAGQRRVRELVLASAVVLCLAAGWWMWSGFHAMNKAHDRIEAAQGELTRRIDNIASMTATVGRREAHAARQDYVDGIESERQRLQRTLRGIARAAPAGVHLTSLKVVRAAEDWHAVVDGISLGSSSADAVRGVNWFYERIPREMKTGAVSVDSFDYGDQGLVPAGARASAVAVRFRISFTAVPDRRS